MAKKEINIDNIVSKEIKKLKDEQKKITEEVVLFNFKIYHVPNK